MYPIYLFILYLMLAIFLKSNFPEYIWKVIFQIRLNKRKTIHNR